MKQILRFIYGILLVLLSSCSEDFVVESAQEVMSDPTTFQMGVKISDMETVRSRTVGVDPEVNTPLWIVVFDANGYLLQYAKAENMQRKGTDEVTFDVTLQSTSEKRIIHFLLGYKSDLYLDFGHEGKIISELSVTDNQDVYWQRKVINGLTKDIVQRDLQRVPLVRNYAKIHFLGGAKTINKFKLTHYCVIHKALSGTVAPYYKGDFVDYQVSDKTPKTYSVLTAEGYQGNMPDNVTYSAYPGTWISANDPSYMYEHKHTTDKESTLTLLLKGTYEGKETYYKVDLVNFVDGQIIPFNILRNFAYQIDIEKVVGPGKNTSDEAYNSPASNNLSMSVLTRNLLNVSDGTSALYVSYTDTVLVSTDEIKLKYKYLANIGNATTSNPDVKFKFNPGPDGNIFDPSAAFTRDDSKEWGELTLTPTGPMPNKTLTQSLIVYNQTSGLSREVVFELRPALNMTVECSPKVVNKLSGSSLNVKITIPGGLKKKMFPLIFSIESQATDGTNNPITTHLLQYISPSTNESNIAAVLGKTIVPIKKLENQKSFHYDKTLTWEEYSSASTGASPYVLSCEFVTNSDVSASVVYVQNKYFNPANDFFENTAVAIIPINIVGGFTSGEDRYGIGQNVKFTFTPDQAGTFELSSPNGSLSFTQSQITVGANKTITIEAATTTWSTEARVTIKAVDKESKPLTINGGTRNKLFVKLAPGSNSPGDNKNVSVTGKGVSESSYKWGEWKNGVYVPISGVNSSTKVSLELTYTTYGWLNSTTYTATLSGKAEEINKGNPITVDFKKQ